MNINSIESLRALYAKPGERALRKELPRLDQHCRRMIELSPFAVIATVGAADGADASPRGGAPGFIKVLDDNTLLIPDAPGNNRLDSLENIIATQKVGLLFMVPGVDETLRINGVATLSRDPAYLHRCSDERRVPKLVILVNVQQAYAHCAKALMRSRLWDADSQVDADTLPTIGQMINDQTGVQTAYESRTAMAKRYASDL